MNNRLNDSVPFHAATETRVINGREFVAIPYTDVLAMTHDELGELFPDGARIVAEGVRAGAARRAQEAESA